MRTPLRAKAYVEEGDRAAVEPAAYAASCVTLLSPAGAVHRGQVWAPPPVALTLPDAALAPRTEPEAWHLDLRQRDRDEILALAPDELAVGDVLAQVLLDLAAHDVAEARVVAIDA